MISTLDAVIESLVDSQSSATATMRQKHVLRESLRALARLAQAEQMRDMRASVRRLTGVATDDTLPAMPGQDRTAQDGGPWPWVWPAPARQPGFANPGSRAKPGA